MGIACRGSVKAGCAAFVNPRTGFLMPVRFSVYGPRGLSCPSRPPLPLRCRATPGAAVPAAASGGAAGAGSAHKGGGLGPRLWFGWPGGQKPPRRQTPPPPQDLPGPTTALVYPCSFRPVSWIRPSLYRRGLPAAKAKRRHKSRLFPFASERMIVGKGVPSDLVALIQGKSHEQRRRANGNGELHRVAQVQYHALSSHHAGVSEAFAVPKRSVNFPGILPSPYKHPPMRQPLRTAPIPGRS